MVVDVTKERNVKKEETDKKKTDWMNSKWRPMMAYLYMAICAFDFVIAPILWSLVQAYYKGGVNLQWQPLTLQGAGLLHLSFGAILGIAAFGRTQEKINGVATVGTTYVPPSPTPPQAVVNTPPAQPQWNTPQPSQSFGIIPQSPQVTMSKNGKAGPIIEEPEL